MRSAADGRSRTGRVAMAAAIAALLLAAAAGGQTPAETGREKPSGAEVARAVEALKADPNLSEVRTIHMLRWRESEQQPEPPSALFQWIAGLFRWIAQSARLLMWTGVALLAALLVFYVARIIHERHRPQPLASFIAPTHVRDLDIRPESLPSDIGGAARQLWERGERRAALALLYRGLLSRLAHVHRVPIRDSSTEGDCLALASIHLTSDRHAYALRLVSVRQRAVYGGQPVETPAVHALCSEFAGLLDSSSSPGPSPDPGMPGVSA